MNLVSYMPPDEFEIRTAMGITNERSGEIELAVKGIFENVPNHEMGEIIRTCLNTIPSDAREAVWTIILIIKYEGVANHKVGTIN